MMHYRPGAVDLAALPPRDVPLHYRDFSIVDGAGFSAGYDPQHVVRHDPRDAHADRGRKWFEDCVREIAARIERWMADSSSAADSSAAVVSRPQIPHQNHQ
jgi:hypothetical protein